MHVHHNMHACMQSSMRMMQSRPQWDCRRWRMRMLQCHTWHTMRMWAIALTTKEQMANAQQCAHAMTHKLAEAEPPATSARPAASTHTVTNGQSASNDRKRCRQERARALSF